MTKADHLDWRTLMSATDETTPETIEALDEYFRHFVAVPMEGNRVNTQYCVGCEEPLTGLEAVLMGRGGFRWGLAHGEGQCSGCGWPARAHHFVKGKDGREILSLENFVLQVHPDFVTQKPKGDGQ